MGVVFQITDDLLDVTSTAEKTGKAVGKDADMGKQTLVTLLGLEGARAEARKARRAARWRRWAPMPPGRRNCRPCRFSCWTGTPEVCDACDRASAEMFAVFRGITLRFHALHRSIRRFSMNRILKSVSPAP